MAFIDYNLLSIVAFIIILAILVYRDRKKFEVMDRIFLVRKTRRWRDVLVSIGTRFPNFWRHFGNVGVVVGFAASIVIFILLFQTLYIGVERVLQGQPAPPGTGIVLPTTSTTPSLQPGLFLIPFWFWIISIAVLIVFHEGFHGIFAARENIRIKSLGVGLLAVLPLAFVEPDEKQMNKKRPMAQLRVLAAGSFINIVIAFTIALLILPSMAVFYEQSGVLVAPIEGFPAADAGLSGLVTGINGMEVRNVTDLQTALMEIEPGDILIIDARVAEDGVEVEKRISIVAVERPTEVPGQSTGFIGITYNPGTAAFLDVKGELVSYEALIEFMNGLMFFMYLLNLGIGLFNLLPLPITDGGKMWQILLKKLSPKKAGPILNGLIWLSVFLILASILIQFVQI